MPYTDIDEAGLGWPISNSRFEARRAVDMFRTYIHAKVHAEECGFDAMTPRAWKRAKQFGFSDAQLGYLWQAPVSEVRAARIAAGVEATFKTVDTCSAEFEAETPYHYSTYEDECEVAPSDRSKVIILGSGPNRIGQGVEFDYCCVHAAFALSEAGYETIMVNCNPETVSTDYDTSDRLYFEPLTEEDVLNVIDAEMRSSQAAAGSGIAGVVVSLGGQTPLKLARTLTEAGVPIWGTPAEAIHEVEDRDRFHALCLRLGIPQPRGGAADRPDDVLMEREVSLRLLRHIASSVRHQQFHDSDIVTVRVEVPETDRGR